MNNETILLNYVKEEFLHGRNREITAQDDLLESGIINSIGLLQLVSFVEENFGVDVPPEDVVYENFNSVAALSAYLEGR